MLKALYEVVSKAGKNMSDASRTSIYTLLESGFNDPDGGFLAWPFQGCYLTRDR